MSEAEKDAKLKWVVLDFETDGLDPEANVILECAMIHVDKTDLQVRSSMSLLVPHTSSEMWWQERLMYMHPAVIKMHTENGLFADLKAERERSRAGNHSWLDECLAAAFKEIAQGESRSIVLCGNSIDFDRGFLKKHCPQAFSFLSHRMIDASALRMLYRAWVGEPPSDTDNAKHRAMTDCEMSLRALRWYGANVFMNNSMKATQ